MNKKLFWGMTKLATLALWTISLAGCWHIKPDPLKCGYGTVEKQVGVERHCIVAPLACGKGTQQHSTGQCKPDGNPEVLKCEPGAFQLEQATGGERECVFDEARPDPGCSPDQVAYYVKKDDKYACRTVVTCPDGTYEQATGGERECVPDNSVSRCGSGTQAEQATGGERECQKQD